MKQNKTKKVKSKEEKAASMIKKAASHYWCCLCDKQCDFTLDIAKMLLEPDQNGRGFMLTCEKCSPDFKHYDEADDDPENDIENHQP